MTKKNNRTGYVLVGLFIGLLIGISVMWWQSNFNNQNWFSFQRVVDVFKSLYSSTDEFFSGVKTKFEKEKSTNKTGTFNISQDSMSSAIRSDSLAQFDSLSMGMTETNGLDYYIDADNLPDSLLWFGPRSHVKMNKDSLLQDTTRVKITSISGDNIQVKRDEMLQFRMIKVLGMSDTSDNHKKYLDSLLINDKMTKRQSSNYYRVEFWKSPVNYTGYKCTRNRIVVYGMNDPDNVSLEYIDHRLFLRYLNTYYLVEPSENFKALTPVKKPEFSGKIKRL